MLTQTLERWCRERMRPGCCLAECATAVVSGSSVVGEGEHKMLALMLAHGAAAAQGSGADPCSHVFISGDADLFLLSLVQGLSKRVAVVSEVDHRQQLLTIWSTELLSDAVTRELLEPGGGAMLPAPRGLGGAVPLTEEARGLRRDFCLISLFSGDDYLPGLSCPIGTKKIYEAYLGQRRRPEFRTELLVRCVETDVPAGWGPGGWAFRSGDEGQAFRAEGAARFEFNLPLLLALMESVRGTENEDALAAEAEEEAARSEAEKEARAAAGRAAVHGYLTGLLWVLELYHHGHCLDFGYIFQRRMWEGGASPRMILQHAPTLASPGAASASASASASVGASASASASASAARGSSDRGESGIEDDLRLLAPRSDQPPLCPLACAVALLPADTAAEYLVQAGGLQPLAPLFCESHAVLGSVVRLERCADCVRLKSAYAGLNKEFQIARKEHNDATSTAAAAGGGGGGQPQQQQAKPPQHTRFAFGSAGTAAAAAAAAASTAASAGSSTVTEEDVADIKARANAASDALR
jgi:hypothetical protein